MLSSRVALIACSNGLGHTRRMLLLARGLVRAGISPTLFAPLEAVERLNETLFPGEPAVDGIHVHSFVTGASAAALRAGITEAITWEARLPDLNEFDLVISDNQPEILARRRDAILSGGFLWHRAIPDMAPKARARVAALLDHHRPPMLTSEAFAPPYLFSDTDPQPIGLFGPGPRPDSAGRDLLVAAGRGGRVIEAFREAVHRFSAGPKPGYSTVWVEPVLLPDKIPSWMRPATFKPDMYAGLMAVACRPGMGTLTDSLWSGARVFAAYEDDNEEMGFNAARLGALGVGEDCVDAENALSRSVAFYGNSKHRMRHAEAVNKLAFTGVEDGCNWILERLKAKAATSTTTH